MARIAVFPTLDWVHMYSLSATRYTEECTLLYLLHSDLFYFAKQKCVILYVIFSETKNVYYIIITVG